MGEAFLNTTERLLSDALYLMCNEYECTKDAYGCDFSWKLVRDLSTYVQTRGVFIASSIEGRFVLELKKGVQNEFPFNETEMLILFTELLYYIVREEKSKLVKTLKASLPNQNQIRRRRNKLRI